MPLCFTLPSHNSQISQLEIAMWGWRPSSVAKNPRRPCTSHLLAPRDKRVHFWARQLVLSELIVLSEVSGSQAQHYILRTGRRPIRRVVSIKTTPSFYLLMPQKKHNVPTGLRIQHVVNLNLSWSASKMPQRYPLLLSICKHKNLQSLIEWLNMNKF